MPRPLCHMIPLNIHEEAYEPTKRAATENKDGNVSELIRSLLYKYLEEGGYITKMDLVEWYV